MSARDHWQNKGSNFMTPFVIRWVDTERYWIELSEGQFLDTHLWGVSVADHNGVRLEEQSKVFESLEDAEAHIFQLEMEDI